MPPVTPPPGSYAYDNLPWFYQFTTLYMHITNSVRMRHMHGYASIRSSQHMIEEKRSANQRRYLSHTITRASSANKEPLLISATFCS